jgi:hypothetical protein
MLCDTHVPKDIGRRKADHRHGADIREVDYLNPTSLALQSVRIRFYHRSRTHAKTLHQLWAMTEEKKIFLRQVHPNLPASIHCYRKVKQLITKSRAFGGGGKSEIDLADLITMSRSALHLVCTSPASLHISRQCASCSIFLAPCIW